MLRLTLVVLCALPVGVVAQRADTVVRLDSLVVTAARRPQLLKDVVVATQLITRQEILQTGAADVASVLLQRGLQPEAGLPGGAGALLRGLGGARLLVLLDGRPLVGDVGGTFDLSRLPAHTLERIEIVTGPQSVLYGSMAMAGVINLISRSAPKRSFAPELTFTAGGHERMDATASAGGSSGGVDYRIDVGRRTVGLAPGVASSSEGFANRWDGTGRLGWQAGTRLQLEANALLVDESQRYRSGQLFRFADRRQADAHVGALWVAGVHELKQSLHVSDFTHLSRASTEAAPVTREGDRDRQRLTEGSLVYAGNLGGTLVDLGIDGRREQIRADRVPGGRRNLDTLEPYLQLTLRAGPLSIAPATRLTVSDPWGERSTSRLAVLYSPTSEVSLRGALAQGFRAPDFKELYIEFVNSAAGYAVRGNPDLQPETSTTASLDATIALGWLSARGQLHATRYRGFIETGEQDAAGTFTYGNVARGSIAGLDAELRTLSDAASVEAAYAFLDTRDHATDTPLLGAARHSARLAVTTAVPLALQARVGAIYTGATPLQRDGNRISAWRDSWIRLDTRLTRRLPYGLSLALHVDNVLDHRMGADWPGFTGRQFAVRASWTPVQP